ncbi:MAG: MarR family winged helix-turn-helix transcriptional regulator [Gemmataceae bacterium]
MGLFVASKIRLDNYCLAKYDEAMTGPLSSRMPRFDSLEQEVFLNLWRTYDRLRLLEDELFSQFELTPQQYNVLRLLRAEHPGSLPTLTLAHRLVSRAPDITRMVDKLERRGLVARERPADNRRTVRVAITDAGMRLLDRMAEPLRQCHRRQLGHLSTQELKKLCTLLQDARQPHEEENSSWRKRL